MRSSLLTFSSKAFAVASDEDDATNPGIYGKALATWLSHALRDKGISASEPIAEDFGWCVPVLTQPHRTYVACANADDRTDQWQVFVFAEGGFLSRLFGKDSRASDVNRISVLAKALLEQHEGVESLRVEV